MEVANNMAVLYADKLRKGLCEYEDIPESLRAVVEELDIQEWNRERK